MNLPTQKLSVCVCSASFGHGRNSAKNLASTWAIWDWAQVVATVSRLRSDRCLTTVGKGGAAAAVEHSGASFWQFRWFFRILRMFSLLPAFPRGTSMTFGFSIFSLQLDQIISIRYVWFFSAGHIQFMAIHGSCCHPMMAWKNLWATLASNIPQVSPGQQTLGDKAMGSHPKKW